MMMRGAVSLFYLAIVATQAKTLFATPSNMNDNDAYQVPTFQLSDLSKSTDKIASILRSTGLLAIQVQGNNNNNNNIIEQRNNDDIAFETTRKIALDGLCQCTGADGNNEGSINQFLAIKGTDKAHLSDRETTRTSFATATVGHSPLPLPHGIHETCGSSTATAMDSLRDIVAHVSNQFVSVLDSIILDTKLSNTQQNSPLLFTNHGGSFETVESIVKASSNLEHFHVYNKQRQLSANSDNNNNNDARDIDNALGLHSDAGLFLAFVPGFDCDHRHEQNHNADGSFYVKVDDGQVKQAVFGPGSVAIMLGVGAESWLLPNNQLKATRHAVRMQSGTKRAWYGMMHLVPSNAIIQSSPTRTFADMKQSMVLSKQKTRVFGDDHASNHDVSIGCGASHLDSYIADDFSGAQLSVSAHRQRARLQHVADASVCNNSTNFYCWMSCLDIPDSNNLYAKVASGQALYCMDPAVYASTGSVSAAVEVCNEAGVVGDAMNSNCHGNWAPMASDVPPQLLSLDGHHSNLNNHEGMEMPYCYGGTTMYMDGFAWQGTTCVAYLFRGWVLSSPGRFWAACLGTILFGMMLEGVIRSRRMVMIRLSEGIQRIAVSTLVYGIQLTMGYLLMLVVMTYSAPLFLSVILGIMGGHFYFNVADFIKTKRTNNNDKNNGTKGTNTNDCICSDDDCIKDKQESDTETPCFCEPEIDSGAAVDMKENNDNGPTPKSYTIPEGATPCCQNTL